MGKKDVKQAENAANQNYIIERIIKDARSEAEELIKTAKSRAAENIKAVKKQLDAEQTASLDLAHAELKEKAEQNEQIAVNEQKKILLAGKQATLSEVFASAKADLAKLGAAESKKLTDTLTKKYGKTGDKIAKADGGIIISNDTYEIKLTLDELLADLRKNTETEVARILFD